LDWAHVPAAGNVLLLVDAGSGWIEAMPSRTRTSQDVIRLLTGVFTRFGIPEVVVTDNAPEFVSDELCSWLACQGASKRESPPYHPQSNGLEERAVQTVKRALRAWNENLVHASFATYLQKVLFHHRNSSHARGRSPAEIVFGRRLRVPVVSRFEQGEPVQYRQGTKASSSADFLMTKGHNTAWILSGDRLILASDNQLAPGIPDTRPQESADCQQLLRRSERTRQQPDRYQAD
jgi:hypothetical protein